MAYAEQNTSSMSKLAGADAKQETVQSVIASFQMQIERVAKLAQQLSNVGDRLEGTRPQNVGEASPETPPHCLTDDLRRKHRALAKLIGDCEDSAMRIANALGV